MLEVLSVVPFRDNKKLVEVRHTWEDIDPAQPWWVFWTTRWVKREKRYQYLTDGIYWHTYPAGDEVGTQKYPDRYALEEAMREYDVRGLINDELQA